MSKNIINTYWYVGLLLCFIIFLSGRDVSAGDAMLSWVAPATNADGTLITDLAGYRVHYGTASQDYSQSMDVGNVTTYQVSNLDEGFTYYFTVSAYDASGNQSDYSNQESKTLVPPPPPSPDITITDSVDPDSDSLIPFSDITEGESSSQTVTVTNDGNAGLAIGSIARTNQLSAPFSISDDSCSGQTILPASSCTFTVRFSPSAPGSFNDTFDVPSNDPDENPVSMSVSGTTLANNPPSANPGGPYSGTEGQLFVLDASASSDPNGSITQYAWDMDNDGTYEYSSASPVQNHMYASNGTYTVTLKVTDNLGATGLATTTVSIADTKPTAQFTASPRQGDAPFTVSFTGTATGYDQPLAYNWDFDNNGTTDSTDRSPTYTYTNKGTYSVKLTVADSDGSIDSLTKTGYISVSPQLFTATVSVSGNGRVTSSPSGIDCSADCSESYEKGTTVTLTAAPLPGNQVESWTGCDSTGVSQCVISMNADRTVSVKFTPSPDITITDSVDPDSDFLIPFSDITEGESSSQTVTVTNDGNAGLAIGSIARTDELSLPFSISDDSCSGQTIPPASSCTFTVRFSPAVPGSFSDTFDVPSNDPNENPVSMSVSGTTLANNPPSANPGGPYSGTEGQLFVLDASASSDPNGSITQYAWDMDNDGTYEYSSASPVQNHMYASNGTYTVTLKVTDNLGATGLATTTVSIADTKPTAQFTASPRQGDAPFTVSFTGTATGYDQPLAYNWDFDNNGTTDSTDRSPTYTYTNKGTYSVKLTVADSDGSIDSLTKTGYISVSPQLFTATVSVSGNGRVTSSPSGIDCSADCSESYEKGTTVTLTAAPLPGNQVESWTGCDSSGVSQCVISMNADRTVSVKFAPSPDITITDSVDPGSDSLIPFSDITEGESSSQTVTVTNDGNAGLAVGSIALTDELSLPFSISDDSCSGQTIPPASSCTFTVRFSPAVPGSFSDTFDVPSNDPDENPVSMSVSGTTLANNPPSANPGGPYSGTEGQLFVLDASASGDPNGSIIEYSWDMDNDGTYEHSSASPVQNHMFASNGTYTVMLKVTDNLGATGVATTTVSIADTGPTAQFTANPRQGDAPLTVRFTGTATGYDQPLLYNWDFNNDGTTDSTDRIPTYTYTKKGTYSVKLTVADSDGSINSLTNTGYISVSPQLFTAMVSVTGNGRVTSSPSGIDCSADCSESYEKGTTVTLTAAPLPGNQVESWTSCDSSGGSQCVISMNADRTVSVKFTQAVVTLSCDDSGSIPCLERTDGGSDGNNLASGKPKADLEYEFRVSVTDSSGSAPEYVRLFMTQRSDPGADNFYFYEMTCESDFVSGARCSYATKLGPAGVHKFYFEAEMADGNVLRYPDSDYLTGPAIHLLTGLNLVGIPRDLAAEQMDSLIAFDSSAAYRWDPGLGYYGDISSVDPVKTGEGYFVEKQSSFLPEHGGFEDITGPEFAYELKPGWNLVANPYPGNVLLNDIKVRKGSSAVLTWSAAVSNGWMTNAVYFYNGSDWGDTYGFSTGTEAACVPWAGYWMYLNMTDDTYYLVIPKP